MTVNRQLMGALGLLILYAAGITWIGFYVSSLLYLCIHMWVLGMRRPAVVLPVTAGVLLGLYSIIELFLRVPLPRGLLV